KLFRDHVHDAAERVRAVQDRCRTADDLDAFGETRVDRGPVFFAPRVVLETTAVVHHEHARAIESAYDGLADLQTGADVADTWERTHRLREGNARLAVDPIAREHAERHR